MKYILSLIALFIGINLPAQIVSTTITKELDTLVISKVQKNKIIKVGKIVYRDSTVRGDTTITVLKKYKPPTNINKPPVANPGPSQTITLPAILTLNGTASKDPDGVISTFAWSKVSGIGGTITSPTSSTTSVINLSAGIYKFRLTVIDNNGASATGDVTVTVNAPSSSSEHNISVTPIPFSDPDIISPGRGAEQWHDGSARIPNPTESQPIGTENSLDVYYRFEAWRLQNSDGSYNWSYFDNLVESAINNGQKLSFGIMTHNSDGGGGVSYGGGESAYPQFLHNQMQSEANKDWLSSDGEWVPNWNSTYYLNWLRSLHTAVANRLKTERHTPTSGPNAGKSVLYGDAIYIIDIRGYGNWGEWHSGGICNWSNYPAGRQPTSATLKAIIDAHTQIFDRWPLGMMIAAYDGGKTTIPLFVPLKDVAYYALTARNAWGEVGARRDQVGAPDSYLKTMLEGNDLTYNGSPTFSSLFLKKWQNAPITGEPNPGVASITGMVDLLGDNGQINKYHHVSFGNGNYPFGSSLSSSTRNNIREGFKKSGYRIELKSGGKVVAGNGSISITLNWQNVGITPTYENWDIIYELVSSTGVVVPLGKSTFKLKLFLPQGIPTVVTQSFTENVSGTYSLRVTVKDPSNYRQPLPLAIQGRTSTGSYILANNISL